MPSTDCYKLRPLNLKGKNYFRVILHTYVFDSLRENTNVGQCGDLLRSANKLAIPGVEIEYNGMLISKSERIRMVQGAATTGGVYRNILLGAQAACWAWGGAGESKSTVMAFVPYEKDANHPYDLPPQDSPNRDWQSLRALPQQDQIPAAAYGAPIHPD